MATTTTMSFAELHKLRVHADLKFCIYCFEPMCICRQLLANVVTAFEDAFEVCPCPLDLHPDGQHGVSHSQLFL